MEHPSLLNLPDLSLNHHVGNEAVTLFGSADYFQGLLEVIKMGVNVRMGEVLWYGAYWVLGAWGCLVLYVSRLLL